METEKKGFFKRFFSGINKFRLIIINVIFFFFFFLFIGFLMPTSSEKIVVEEGTVLLLNPLGIINETKEETEWVKSFFDENYKTFLLEDLTKALKNAASDRRISEVFFDLSGMKGVSLGQLKEIAEALKKYKESNKKLYVFSPYYDLFDYYIASFADEIYMDPLGEITLSGFYSEGLFFGETAEKFGISWNVAQAGNYKQMGETFSQKKMSVGVKENTKEVFSDLWELYITEISKNRKIDKEKILYFVENYREVLKKEEGRKAEAALKAGLITKIKNYEDSLFDVGLFTEFSYPFYNKNLLSFKKYNKVFLEKNSFNKIGVIYLTGEITSSGSFSQGKMTPEESFNKLNSAITDPSIRAVVLRIDSGGGEVFASEEIRREVERVIKYGKKPVIVSMGSVAASGAYWISSSADYIFASPYTITGSIGVFSITPTIENFLNTHLGIYVDGVKIEGHNKYSLFKNLTQEEKELNQLDVMNTYETFLKTVSKGRNINIKTVEALAGGKIYAAERAKTLGLIDEIGSFADAIDFAARRAEMEDYSVMVIEKKLSPKEEFLKALFTLKDQEASFSELKSLYEIANLSKKDGVYVYNPIRALWNSKK